MKRRCHSSVCTALLESSKAREDMALDGRFDRTEGVKVLEKKKKQAGLESDRRALDFKAKPVKGENESWIKTL